MSRPMTKAGIIRTLRHALTSGQLRLVTDSMWRDTLRFSSEDMPPFDVLCPITAVHWLQTGVYRSPSGAIRLPVCGPRVRAFFIKASDDVASPQGQQLRAALDITHPDLP